VEIGSFWLHRSKLEPESRPTFTRNLRTSATYSGALANKIWIY